MDFGKFMQSKILSRRTLLITVLAGLALFTALLFYFISKSSFQSSALVIENTAALQNQEQTLPTQEQANPGLPVRLKIPRINVDAAVEYVRYAPDGTMAITESLDDVAWFEPGQRPGENGSAVIAGHYGYRNGKTAVFDKLSELRKGDKLSIEDDKGVIISFVVREIRRYDPNADTSGVFGSTDGKPHLNLITCAGVWNEVSETFSKRLVVFTDKE